jgi:hypothetical protein
LACFFRQTRALLEQDVYVYRRLGKLAAIELDEMAGNYIMVTDAPVR